MFIDYLINVVLVGVTYWAPALIVFVLGFVYRKKIGPDIWSSVKFGTIFIAIVGLVMGLSSSANTYKNTVDYNRYQDQTMIEQRRESQSVQPIVDRTRQPLTEEELQEREVDMRERVDLDAGN